MNDILWLLAIVLLVVIELCTFNFVTIWFAGGALFSLIASLLGLDIIWQMWIFIITSLFLLIFTKPFVRKKFNKDKIPKRYYYQLNGKSPMETYIENRKDLIQSYNKRNEDNLKQAQEQKNFEKILEKSLDKEVHKQLDKIFLSFSK